MRSNNDRNSAQLNLVTTLNQRLWLEYGERFAKEFSQNTDGSIALHIIFEFPPEGGVAPVFDGEHVFFHTFHDPSHQKFLAFFGNLWEANGYKLLRDVEGDSVKSIRLVDDYRFNAVRFSFKPFALNQFRLSELGANTPFAWIDGDVRVLSTLTSKNLSEFIPSGKELMSFLGREQCESIRYSECGFLGFNPIHRDIDRFFTRLISIYCSGEIFSHKEWHDSWLWDVVRREFSCIGDCLFKNLAEGVDHLPHPFINSGLGRYFDHLKGPKRKVAGTSFASDRAS